MKCTEAEALFVDAGDGRLDLSQEVRLAGHLDGCSACRERAVVWRRLVPGMRGLAPEAPDAMRVRRMQIEIERRLAPVARAPHGSRERWVRWSAALVFASAAALAVLWIRRPADKRMRAGGDRLRRRRARRRRAHGRGPARRARQSPGRRQPSGAGGGARRSEAGSQRAGAPGGPGAAGARGDRRRPSRCACSAGRWTPRSRTARRTRRSR